MEHISYILQDEYEYLLQKKHVLEKAFHEQSKRKRESCEQWAETRHDNADYEDAERQQNMIGKRITDLQHTIASTKITLYNSLQNTEKKVVIGATVRLNIDWKDATYTIGWSPTIPGRISYASPLGKTIIQRKAWDVIRFIHERKEKRVHIISVE